MPSAPQSNGDQRASTRSQLNMGLFNLLFTVLCTRHIHCRSSLPLFTAGGSRLPMYEEGMHIGFACMSALLEADIGPNSHHPSSHCSGQTTFWQVSKVWHARKGCYTQALPHDLSKISQVGILSYASIAMGQAGSSMDSWYSYATLCLTLI